MRFVRLLVVVLVCCSPLALAQTSSNAPSSSATLQQSPLANFNLEAKADSEPWRIIPKDTSQTGSTQDWSERLKSDKPKDGKGQDKTFGWQTTPQDESQAFVITPGGTFPSDATCYKIRSYVVARDGKNSDSTHPVGYSTCQPARRYGLKKVEVGPSERNH